MNRRSNPDASDGGGTVRRLRRACARLWTSTRRVAFGCEADAPPESDGETTDWESMADFTLETGYTPERYVLELLDERGGEVRQQTVLEETGWARSTTSRVLSRLEERGEVVRVRVGAENVVYLPADAPDAATPADGTPMMTT
ncbi:helix-turn-helix transcriptional regulator [Halomicrococcus gelatinilyticus]|uniref:helix-turn-helix transcriptional regulator n=1 Tax=Halomicrococcus gelatinilyticus TaxID=1702103 RepID=UPI002E0D41D6